MYRSSTPEFLIVSFDHASHHNAVQRLIRPWEVEHLIDRSGPSVWEVIHRPTFAEKMAQWFKGEFASYRLSYRSDPSAFDVWYSPGTTIRRRAGDCEDLTLLGVSIFLAAGSFAHVAIGTVWDGASFGGHAWIEGEDEKGFFLLEATSGELHRYRPPQYRLSWHITPNPNLMRAA